MRNIKSIGLIFCLLVLVISCTQNNYHLRAVGLANNTDLVVKFNNKTGKTWVLIGRAWNLVVDNDHVPMSDYAVWITSGTKGNSGGVFRINEKTGESWSVIDMVWVKIE